MIAVAVIFDFSTTTVFGLVAFGASRASRAQGTSLGLVASGEGLAGLQGFGPDFYSRQHMHRQTATQIRPSDRPTNTKSLLFLRCYMCLGFG